LAASCAARLYEASGLIQIHNAAQQLEAVLKDLNFENPPLIPMTVQARQIQPDRYHVVHLE
jgi:hypothetical protein